MSAIALVISSAFAMLAVAAVKKPLPPSKVCIGNNCTAAAPSVAGDIKWHPGHYVWVSGPGYNSKVQAATSQVLAANANNSNLAGVQIIFKWADLEGDTPGDYSAGFALVDSLLAKLAALPKPKQLMISLQERSFGTATGLPPGGLYPKYLSNTGGVTVAPAGVRWSGALQSIAKLDSPAVIDRLIALSQAYGKRYNSNPLVEMYVPIGELAVSQQAQINAGAYVAQLKRLYAASADAWPNTLLRWQFNFAPADSDDKTMLSLLAFAKTIPQSVIGGPDPESPLPLPATYPVGTRTIQGNKVFRGLKSGSSGGTQQAYEDLRGKLPWVGEYQGGPGFGAGSILPTDFGDYEINVMHASYLIYCYNTWLPVNTASTDPHKWAAQLAYINSVHGATFTGISAPQVAGN